MRSTEGQPPPQTSEHPESSLAAVFSYRLHSIQVMGETQHPELHERQRRAVRCAFRVVENRKHAQRLLPLDTGRLLEMKHHHEKRLSRTRAHPQLL